MTAWSMSTIGQYEAIFSSAFWPFRYRHSQSNSSPMFSLASPQTWVDWPRRFAAGPRDRIFGLARRMAHKRNPAVEKYARLRRAMKTQPVGGVTCRGKTDGGGAQIQAIMSTQVFASKFGLKYIHTPLKIVQHAVGDPTEWAAKWEASFGLGEGHPREERGCPIVSLDEFVCGYEGPTPILEALDFHDFCDMSPDEYVPLRDEFRSRCQLLRQASEIPYAAIHIRRGDVAVPGAEKSFRLTPLGSIAKTISLIQQARPELEIRIFSQGDARDFTELPASCILRLNADVFGTLTELMSADLLITAKSSFSYVAALLSRGSVLYDPFWHKPLSSWTVLAPDGSFNEADLGRKA